MLLYFRGEMKALVVLAQRQLRLPLASRRAGEAHGHSSCIARKRTATPETLSGQRISPHIPPGTTPPLAKEPGRYLSPGDGSRVPSPKTSIPPPQHPPAPRAAGTGTLTCIPRAVGRQQHPQQQGRPRSHAGPIPGPSSIPLFEPENRRSEAAQAGGPGVGVVFARLRSLLTALAELATPPIKSSSGLGGGSGFLKPAPFSPSYEAGASASVISPNTCS